MIKIEKHIISEAFEQLAKTIILKESSNTKWTDPLELSDDITLVPGRTYITPKRYYYSSIKELEMDASDSFRDMINLAKRLGWVNKNQWIVIPKGTFLTYQDSDNPGGAGYINFIVNNNQNDVFSFSTDVSEDLDFIATFKEATASADWSDETDVDFSDYE